MVWLDSGSLCHRGMVCRHEARLHRGSRSGINGQDGGRREEERKKKKKKRKKKKTQFKQTPKRKEVTWPGSTPKEGAPGTDGRTRKSLSKTSNTERSLHALFKIPQAAIR